MKKMNNKNCNNKNVEFAKENCFDNCVQNNDCKGNKKVEFAKEICLDNCAQNNDCRGKRNNNCK